MLSRRSFLVRGSVGVAAATAVAPLLQAQQPVDEWEAVRREFELDPRYVHLSLFYMTPNPRPVREAIQAYRRQLDSEPFHAVEHAMFSPDHENLPVKATTAIAAYINAKPEEIALTQNTTAGLALLYHGVTLKAGDEILTTTHDHMVHHESIRLACERSGATWRKIALFDDPTKMDADAMIERIRKAITPKTRIVGVTWVHSSTGLKLPIARVAEVVKRANANRTEKNRLLLFVDGVHGFGSEITDVAAMGCDGFAAGTHKWLFGPRGTGFVWARGDVWSTMRPLFPSFTSFDLFQSWAAEKTPAGPPRADWFTPGGFWAFEHYWAVPAAIDFHRAIGSQKITARIHQLNAMAKDELAKMPHVKLYTPRTSELSSGIVCFDVDGVAPGEVVRRLLASDGIIASTTPYARPYARVAFGIVNGEQDVERFRSAVAKLPLSEKR